MKKMNVNNISYKTIQLTFGLLFVGGLLFIGRLNFFCHFFGRWPTGTIRFFVGGF